MRSKWAQGGNQGPFDCIHSHPGPSCPYLHVVGPQHDPATEAIAQVDDGHAAAEAHDTGQSHPQRGNENLWGAGGSGWDHSLRGEGRQAGPHQRGQRLVSIGRGKAILKRRAQGCPMLTSLWTGRGRCPQSCPGAGMGMSMGRYKEETCDRAQSGAVTAVCGGCSGGMGGHSEAWASLPKSTRVRGSRCTCGRRSGSG